ncbi:CRISPR system precrRNA processing endoribonuclease RAMP protein Cas6 [Neisseria leonii]|uniref:CRISPR system precrRNA processing endoribonuclease RAMP protein Cas6 n=1 Tax=Neisseria leonii TaxID=2995413 RepID=UPI00237A9E2D|nr:CRISPR system precrRNA processing endoribonuclease RAMP protein Cas6 [Neisseria sp. 3986]MDD9325381.1 CRISPR system precrRNA processing endoribonuclease RAMP protein Cas6 [Neisseria sp. 3986]
MTHHQALKLPHELPLARYRFDFTVESELRLPEYAGSTLRGAFGHALRRAACMTRQKECGGCPLQQSCPYTRLFAPTADNRLSSSFRQTPPAPYIIEAPENGRTGYGKGETFSFEMVLLGRARSRLPLIAHSFQQAFRRGIGPLRGQGVLGNIAVETPEGWQSIFADGQILPHPDTLVLPLRYPETCTLHIRTPIRLQSKSSVLGIRRVQAGILLRQLMRRISAIATRYWEMPLEAEFGKLAAVADSIPNHADLQWQDWTRYSNRQQQKMVLGGITGTWQFNSLPLAFAQLLYIGQWLHIGKETVFGLGRYQLSEPPGHEDQLC